MSSTTAAEKDESFEEYLKAAVRRGMTPEEREEQAISFVLGTMGSNSTITREEVVKIVRASSFTKESQ